MGLHVLTISLKPNVTMEQFKSAYMSQLIPVYEKHFNTKGYLMKGDRGESKDSFGIVWLWKTEQDRDKFFTPDGPTALGKEAMEKVSASDKELDKLGTRTSKFTNWVVQ